MKGFSLRGRLATGSSRTLHGSALRSWSTDRVLMILLGANLCNAAFASQLVAPVLPYRVNGTHKIEKKRGVPGAHSDVDLVVRE